MAPGKPSKNRRPWWVRLILYLIPLWIILAIVLSVEISGRRAYNRAMQEAKLDGPVTIEEIEAARKVWPDEQNGVRVIIEVAPRLPDLHEKGPHDALPIVGQAGSCPLGEKWPAQVLSDVDKYLAEKSSELQMIDQILPFKGGRFPIVPQPNPLTTQFPHLGGLRTSAKLKTLQAVRKSMAGDVASLVPDLQVILLHGKLLQEEPFLLSSLLHVALDALTVDTLQQLLAQSSPSREQLQAIGSLLAIHDVEDRLAWGLRGERSMVIGAGEWLRSPGGELRARIPGLRGRLLRDEAMAITLWSSIVAIEPGAERARRAAEIGAEAAGLPDRYSFTKITVPSLERAMQLDARTTGIVRSAIAALAAERYRMDKGRFPSRLDELTPGYLETVPLDPFDDKPLKYWVTDREIVIYSIGDDLADSSGDVAALLPPGSQPGDWGFVLLKPEFRGRPAARSVAPAEGIGAEQAATGPMP